jgi:hypothetical protein
MGWDDDTYFKARLRAISITVVGLVWLLAAPGAAAGPLPRCTDQGWVGAIGGLD